MDKLRRTRALTACSFRYRAIAPTGWWETGTTIDKGQKTVADLASQFLKDLVKFLTYRTK